MTLDQFRTKWGLMFSSLVICELITRVDSNLNAPLTAAGNELADDLRKLLAEASSASTVGAVEFPRRERTKLVPSGEGER
jgi:hypothetical protein